MSRTTKKKSPKAKGKAIDSSCKNNGSCHVCNCNRTYHNKKREQSAQEQEESYERTPIPWFKAEDLDD